MGYAGKRKKKKLLWTLCILLMLTVGLVWFLHAENTVVTVSELAFGSETLPEQFDGYRILQVSDLHNAALPRLLERSAAGAPDCIFLTGDMIDVTTRAADFSVAMDYIRSLTALAPTYFVTGNHELDNPDYLLFKAQLQEAGVVVLSNDVVVLEEGGSSIALLGVEDFLYFLSNDRYGQILRSMKETADQVSDFSVLLAHRPEKMDIYAAVGFDLVFSGHAHGGQIRLPFVGAVSAPGQGLWPKYTEGLYTEGETSMIVSRGLGNSSRFSQRLFNRPELVFVTLQRLETES